MSGMNRLSNRALTLVFSMVLFAIVLLGGFMILPTRHSTLIAPADPEGLTRHTFTLAGSEFALLMPAEYTLAVDDDAQVRFTLPDRRVDRSLILSAVAPSVRFAEGNRSIKLENGHRMQYIVVPDLGAGSGGTVSEMVGQIGIGSMLLTVECRDQDELEPEPTWCIPYLHHLKSLKGL